MAITWLVPPLADEPYGLVYLLTRFLQIMPGQVLVNLIAGLPLIFLLAWFGPYARNRRDGSQDETMIGDSLWRAV